MNHYERLGVTADAPVDEVRAAYRRAARAHHPDASGDRSAVEMAEVNRAWWVLRDPQRRQVYDASLIDDERPPARASAPPRSAGGPPSPFPPQRTRNPLARYQDPPRFPWRFMAVLAALGIGVVLLGVILDKPSKPPPVDNVLTPGSCVTIQPNDDAAEVHCTDAYDAVVAVVVPFGDRCPFGTEPHRDRQGLGTACVQRGPTSTTGG